MSFLIDSVRSHQVFLEKNVLIRHTSNIEKGSFPSLADLKFVKDWGFDIEDTLVIHPPGQLLKKFLSVLHWYHFNQGKSKKSIEPLNLLNLDHYAAVSELNLLAQEYPLPDRFDAGKKLNIILQGAISWVKAIDHDDHRDLIVQEIFGINREKFWEVYSDFSQRLTADPAEYARLNGQVPVSGAVNLLNALIDNGKNIHIVTNASLSRSSPYIDILKENGFKGKITSFTSAQDSGKKKPAPDSLQAVIDNFNLQQSLKGRVPLVYIGNAATDWQASNTAKTIPIIFNTYRFNFNLYRAVPRFECQGPQDLLSQLINQQVLK